MVRNPWLEPPSQQNPAADWVLAAVCIAVLFGTLVWRSDFFRQTLRYTLQSLSIAGVLYLAVARARFAPFRWLNTRVLVYLGTVSYTIYLAHYVVLLCVEEYAGSIGKVLVAVLTAAITLVIAELMRRFVERPFAALRRRLHDSTSAKGRSFDVPAPNRT
jgi:peptidoglycan/LPS O-acetylase OafA/YrhL